MDTLFIKPAGTTLAAWVTQLETWVAAAQADLAAGKTITQVGAGDSYNTKQVSASPSTRLKELIKALAVYDPANYTAPATRTTIQFQ